MTDDERKKRSEQLRDRYAIGPTGSYPAGKLNEQDDGELRVAIGVEVDKVVLHFGKKVAWVALTREQAINIATLLQLKAESLPA